ncbi:MAG: (d)CMP kinase [Bacteroidetes bacterium]|jgi:cytidylate kinase|nr:(d)CMP kinase [Bacteroidota bacterium]
MKKIIITLDGYSSCGKSTLAKQMAAHLNYVFIDSGAMYRAITLYFIRHRIDVTNSDAVIEALTHIHLAFILNEQTGRADMYLNNENVEEEIRGLEVSNNVSQVAALEPVRIFSVAQQQLMGTQKGIVMDGRDIGTAVFPEAELKIFVTASPEVRIERRYQELVAKDPAITKAEIQANLEMRDHIDSTREFSPLKQAHDALVLDNSSLTRDEQLELALSWAQERIANA